MEAQDYCTGTEGTTMRPLLLTLLLAGCATNASLKYPEETSYVAVECYEAGLIYKLFSGGVEGCRVLSHNTVLSESVVDRDAKGAFSATAETVAD